MWNTPNPATAGLPVLPALALAMLLGACGGGDGGGTDNGGETDAANGLRPPDDGSDVDAFPTVWGLSAQRFDLFQSMYIVRERWVVAYADGTYTSDLDAIHAGSPTPLDGDARSGEWRIVDGELLTRTDPDGEFGKQYFSNHTTTPAAPNQSLDGCYEGTEVPFGFAIVFRSICFDGDGSYRRSTDNLDDFEPGDSSGGTYSLDRFTLWLTDDGGEQARGAFAILAGGQSDPSSIMVEGRRYSR